MARVNDFRVLVPASMTGSVTATAREFGRSQSTVTRSLRRLEDELGVQLFHRRPSFRPTGAGRAVLPYAEAVVSAADDALAAVRPVCTATCQIVGADVRPSRPAD